MIRSRPPTGAPSWPLILLEGPEFSGKTTAAADFAASDRVGACYWVALGEPAPEERSGFEVVVHNGGWHDIVEQVGEVHAAAAGTSFADAPTVLVVDSMTAEWELLKDWISGKARESRAAQKLLREDPNADIRLSNALWDAAAERHEELMRLLTTFNGFVVVTARCKDIVGADAEGRPIPWAADYRVDAHRGLAHAATVWVRFSRDDAPTLIGARTPQLRIRPGVDKAPRYPDFHLEHLLFEELGYTTAVPRTVTPLISNEAELLAQARDAVRAYVIDRQMHSGVVLREFQQRNSVTFDDCDDVGVILRFLADLKQRSAA